MCEKTLLGEVHKLLRLYLKLPVASATSKRTFSALRRLKNYLRSTMKQDRLNNCLLMHCHESIRTHCTLLRLQKGLLVPTNYAKHVLGNLSRGMRLAWCTIKAPPRFKTLRLLCIVLFFTSVMFAPVFIKLHSIKRRRRSIEVNIALFTSIFVKF